MKSKLAAGQCPVAVHHYFKPNAGRSTNMHQTCGSIWMSIHGHTSYADVLTFNNTTWAPMKAAGACRDAASKEKRANLEQHSYQSLTTQLNDKWLAEEMKQVDALDAVVAAAQIQNARSNFSNSDQRKKHSQLLKACEKALQIATTQRIRSITDLDSLLSALVQSAEQLTAPVLSALPFTQQDLGSDSSDGDYCCGDSNEDGDYCSGDSSDCDSGSSDPNSNEPANGTEEVQPSRAPHKDDSSSSKALQQLDMSQQTFKSLSCSRYHREFSNFMRQANAFFLKQEQAERMGCKQLHMGVANQMKEASNASFKQFASSVYTGGSIRTLLTDLCKVAKEAALKLANNITQKRKRNQAKSNANNGGGDEKRMKETKSTTVESGLGGCLQWDAVGWDDAPGPITGSDLEYIGQQLQSVGWLNILPVLKDLGYCAQKTGSSSSWDFALRQILSAMPALTLRLGQSRHVYLMDAIEVPEPVLYSLMDAGSSSTISHANHSSSKMMKKLESKCKSDFEADEVFWGQIAADPHIEYVSQLPPSERTVSKKVLQYPDIITHIKSILAVHGSEAAHSRRRDDRAHTIGVGCRRVRELLFNTFQEKCGHTTIWRFYNVARSTDVRPIRDGGRYNLIDASTTKVRNSQFVKPHARGPWCVSKIRYVEDLSVDLSLRPCPIILRIFAVDNLAKLPTIMDAASHIFARKRGYVLTGDDRDNYDHNHPVGKKLLVETTGIVELEPPENPTILTDEYGRPRYSRCTPVGMTCFNRAVPMLVKGTSQYSHWRDQRAALDNVGDEKLDAAFWTVDNGSGFDPTDETNQYYLGKVIDDYGLMFAGTGSFAANESARHTAIERPWSQAKKAVIGQRLGEQFLGGRREPTLEERDDFFRACSKQLKDVWESTMNIAPNGAEKVAPRVEYVEPLDADEVREATKVKNFMSTSVSKEVEKEENKEMREYVRGLNGRTVQTLNAVWIFSPKCTPEILRELFGPTMKPCEPETFISDVDQKKHHKTYLQLKEQYKSTAQTTYEAPALQGMEQSLRCCDR